MLHIRRRWSIVILVSEVENVIFCYWNFICTEIFYQKQNRKSGGKSWKIIIRYFVHIILKEFSSWFVYLCDFHLAIILYKRTLWMEEIQIYIYLSDIIKIVTNTNLLRSCRQLLDIISQSSLLPDYKGAVAVAMSPQSPLPFSLLFRLFISFIVIRVWIL